MARLFDVVDLVVVVGEAEVVEGVEVVAVGADGSDVMVAVGSCLGGGDVI